MGARGPRPKPTQLKLVAGTRKDRVNRAEPVPVAAGTDPPKWLSKVAREVWERLAPDMVRKGVLTEWDVDALARLCTAVAHWRDAQEHLEREGTVVSTPVFNKNGDITGERMLRSQYWLVAKDADDVLIRLSARFGLTPSDRSQLKVGDAPSANPKARLLS